MRTRLLAVSIVSLLAMPAFSMVAAASTSTPVPTTTTHKKTIGGYLGVFLGPVPAPLRTQLGALLPSGQGVMIRDVMADSPAAKAGLKNYDVVIAYNDQRLYSAEQFNHLVRAEHPNTTATLRVVHDGVAEQIKVTLGTVRETAYPEMAIPIPHYQPGPHGMSSDNDDRNWESFDSLSLKKLDNGNFKADIQFLGDEGKLVKKEYKGTRESIRNQIVMQQDLPPPERQQLLEALSARDYFMPSSGWYAPGFYSPEWFSWQSDF